MLLGAEHPGYRDGNFSGKVPCLALNILSSPIPGTELPYGAPSPPAFPDTRYSMRLNLSSCVVFSLHGTAGGADINTDPPPLFPKLPLKGPGSIDPSIYLLCLGTRGHWNTAVMGCFVAASRAAAAAKSLCTFPQRADIHRTTCTLLHPLPFKSHRSGSRQFLLHDHSCLPCRFL